MLFLVFKTKNDLFYIIFKVFFFMLYVCIRFNFVMFFSLVFVYTCLSILVYLQFTKFRLVFMWLTTQENKFGEGVKQTGFTWNFLQPPMQMCESASIPYIKINMLFFCCCLFFKDFLNPQDQQNGIRTFFEQHPSPSDIIRDKSFHIPRKSLGFYVSSDFLLNFLSIL